MSQPQLLYKPLSVTLFIKLTDIKRLECSILNNLQLKILQWLYCWSFSSAEEPAKNSFMTTEWNVIYVLDQYRAGGLQLNNRTEIVEGGGGVNAVYGIWKWRSETEKLGLAKNI